MSNIINDPKIQAKLDAEIAKITAQAEKELADKIAKLKLNTEAECARKDLRAQHEIEVVLLQEHQKKQMEKLYEKFKEEAKAFTAKYGIEFYTTTVKDKSKPFLPFSTEAKIKLVLALKNEDGSVKYMLNAQEEIVGSKGDPIKSTIVFKHKGKKETLSVSALANHLKKEYANAKKELVK